ncbi:pentapeptide repeat-containing protein, partial [Lacticaseibacillus paracasei]|uniref:pentapeptide repeat-containing protein n=1 Tax=Lacticaseibacillus paracasei TaxID=1597 RepID=UPI002ADED3BD
IKLSQAQLANVDFTGAEITSVNFDNAFMGCVILNDAEICDSSMEESWLDGAEANNNTSLTSCNLTDAKLANTTFIGSDKSIKF